MLEKISCYVKNAIFGIESSDSYKGVNNSFFDICNGPLGFIWWLYWMDKCIGRDYWGGYKNGICIVLLLVNLADLQDVLGLFLQVANGVIERQVRQSHFLFFRKFSFVF